MDLQKEFKRVWSKTKKQLLKISDDAIRLAKKGEKELIKLSEKGRIQLEITLLNFKKEQLFYKIGKVAAKQAKVFKQNKKLEKLYKEFLKINRQLAKQKSLLRKKK